MVAAVRWGVAMGVERERAHLGEELDELVLVERSHVGGLGRDWNEGFHVLVEIVVQEQAVGHSDTMGLHRVARPVVVVADVGIVEIRHLHTGGAR